MLYVYRARHMAHGGLRLLSVHHRDLRLHRVDVQPLLGIGLPEPLRRQLGHWVRLFRALGIVLTC